MFYLTFYLRISEFIYHNSVFFFSQLQEKKSLHCEIKRFFTLWWKQASIDISASYSFRIYIVTM